jgi:N-glycosylase/DNA lyase
MSVLVSEAASRPRPGGRAITARTGPRQEATVRILAAGQEIEFVWGEPHQLGTAAYWVEQTRLRRPSRDHRLGCSLPEEVVACILGGYGIPAGIGLAAFEEVRAAALVRTDPAPSADEVEAVLARPMALGAGRLVRYRFAAQRAKRVSAALLFLAEHKPPSQARELRDWLLAVPGVGPKTAAWITRNRLGAENVAIIDVHVRRAGLAAGFFCPSWKLPVDYGAYEEAFCAVAEIGRVSSASLDARIWRDLSFLGRAWPLLLGEAPSRTVVSPP